MSFVSVRISLLSAPDDPPVDNDALQSAFGKFRQFLRICDIRFDPNVLSGHRDRRSGGGLRGRIHRPPPPDATAPLSAIVSAWLEQRAGRRGQLRIGESCAVAQSTDEAESFLFRARQLRATPSPVFHKS